MLRQNVAFYPAATGRRFGSVTLRSSLVQNLAESNLNEIKELLLPKLINEGLLPPYFASLDALEIVAFCKQDEPTLGDLEAISMPALLGLRRRAMEMDGLREMRSLFAHGVQRERVNLLVFRPAVMNLAKKEEPEEQKPFIRRTSPIRASPVPRMHQGSPLAASAAFTYQLPPSPASSPRSSPFMPAPTPVPETRNQPARTLHSRTHSRC